jgi:SWI/SNF-related matrix-associated actin-dependent regulator 1 of chromatin subfamily A
MIAMTGTPLPNRPREAYTLARGLNWEAVDYLSKDGFMDRFNPSVRLQQGHNLEVRGRLPELNARLRCNMMVRRRKKDVLPQLPDKRYEMTYIEPNGAIRDVLAREALIDFDPMDLFNSDFTLDGTPISTLRREMGEAIVPRVVEYIQYMMDVVEHPKLIVFAHHRSVISELMDQLSKYNPVVQIGGMTDSAKDKSKFDFMLNPACRIFIGQLDTMEGVDGLQSVCGDVVFAEPAWTPGRNEQCVDRAHRIGQHDNVVAHFLLVEGSFNEKVLNVVLDKSVDIYESLDRRLV